MLSLISLGPKPPVLIECAGKQCGDACSEGICDGHGGCVSPDYNPCTVHGCDGKRCGERCSAGDIMGICNKDGDCKIDTDFEFCDGIFYSYQFKVLDEIFLHSKLHMIA